MVTLREHTLPKDVQHDSTYRVSLTIGVPTEDEQIKKRWREYFDQLLNTENQRGILEQCDEVEGPEMTLERVEVEKALKRMKLGKAGGPTELTSDMLFALGDEGVDWLTELLNKV